MGEGLVTMTEDQEGVPRISRNVSEEDKQDLRNALEEIRAKVKSKQHLSFQTMDCQCSFSRECIAEIIDHAPHIFTLDYVLSNLSIYHPTHAMLILAAVQEIFEDIHVYVEIDSIFNEYADMFTSDLTMETTFAIESESDNSDSDLESDTA
jgi:hypothetical protein